MLRIYDLILEVLRELMPLLRRIEQRDADLGRQMRRALASVPLNVAEGSSSRGGNRAARYHTAAGSTQEVLAVLDVAAAFEYIPTVDAALLDKLRKIVSTLKKVAL